MPKRAPSKRQIVEPPKIQADTIWIGIRASDANLERLGALLLFADIDFKVQNQTEPAGPMMFEDPAEHPLPAEADHVDYEVVKREIFRHLEKYVAKHDGVRAKNLLMTFGAPKVSLIPQDRLLELEAALKAAVE